MFRNNYHNDNPAYFFYIEDRAWYFYFRFIIFGSGYDDDSRRAEFIEKIVD